MPLARNLQAKGLAERWNANASLVSLHRPASIVLPPAACQQSLKLDIVVTQVDLLDTGQACVAEESPQVVSHPSLAVGQGGEHQVMKRL